MKFVQHHALETAEEVGSLPACQQQSELLGGGEQDIGRIALLALAVVGDLAGARLALDHRDAVAGLGRALEAEHLDG